MRHSAMAVRPSAVLLLAATAAFFAACSDNTPSGPSTAPEIGTPNVSTPDSAGPVLVVSVATLHADSARIVAASVPVGFHVKTDYVRVANDTARLVLAGLRPGVDYLWHVDAVGPGGKRSGPGLTLTADSLPPAIRSAKIVTTAGSVPTVPYIATELTADSTKYETIFDSTGALVWYRVMARPSWRHAADVERAIGLVHRPARIPDARRGRRHGRLLLRLRHRAHGHDRPGVARFSSGDVTIAANDPDLRLFERPADECVPPRDASLQLSARIKGGMHASA